LDLRIYLFFF